MNFRKALHSDCATWILFSGMSGVRTIPNARLRWREHAEGISSGQKLTHRDLIYSEQLRLMRWLNELARVNPDLSPPEMHRITLDFFLRCVCFERPAPTFSDLHKWSETGADIWRMPVWSLMARMMVQRLRARLRVLPGFQAVARWRHERRTRRVAASQG